MSTKYTLKDLLIEMTKMGASDLHITVASPPRFRIDGKLKAGNYPPLNPDKVKDLVYSVLNEQQKKRFEMEKELDFSFGIKNIGRFRGNAYLQRGCVGGAFRMIPYEVWPFEKLGLPPVVREMSTRPKGLILVTGPTGSGKSTTLATIIDKINTDFEKHIITIEDPIEFIHKHKKCMINQRQILDDTNSFNDALKHVLRQDPDVILIGEMRDKETIEAALRIAETGHLCLATLHTNSASESINRIIDVFPSTQQSQIRTQLSFILEGILCQSLLPKIRGGRVMAVEILVSTPAIRAVIRDDKVHQIYSLMQAGKKYGMKTLNQSLYELIINRQIAEDDGIRASHDPVELQKMLGKI